MYLLVFLVNSAEGFVSIHFQNQYLLYDKNIFPFLDEGILRGVMNLFISGCEPTVSVAMWIFLLMTRYPELQKKCRHVISMQVNLHFSGSAIACTESLFLFHTVWCIFYPNKILLIYN